MKYYVVADVHGFYDELMTALKDSGYFCETKPHKLIICGDIFDRGKGAVQLQKFICDLLSKDEVILIRGNHEDLFVNMLIDWKERSYLFSHNQSNGTVDTVCQLTGVPFDKFNYGASFVKDLVEQTPFMRTIIHKMIDYYETDKYIFVHGWIPCNIFRENPYALRYEKMNNWRKASMQDWNIARWTNGMAAANDGAIEEGKTIVCGHWHCSYGHSRIEGNGSEFGSDADFSPYYATGILAIDGCTAVTHKVNCVVLED